MTSLSTMFSPKSIAIIGASRDPKKIGAIVLKNLIEGNFKGQLYPINPQAKKISKLTVYPNYSSLPQTPDLAVIAIPAQFINPLLPEIAAKGTQNIVVFSAGYKETGAEGALLETELVSLCSKHQLNLLGPNCLGFVNTTTNTNVTFSQVVKHQGNLRFISQSGAIASAIFDWFAGNGLGFSEFVTLGNKAVLNENHILEHWLNTSQQSQPHGDGWSDHQPIGMYLESIATGQAFIQLLQTATQKDPVFILKPGKSKAAAKAMQSHTGAIAGEDAVLDTALRQSGAIRCSGLEEMFDLSRAFSWQNPPTGPKVVVISNAGGPAVISADAISESGLTLAPIGPSLKQKLSQVLPRAASFVNPVDVLGDALADRYYQALDIVLQSSKVDSVVVILTPQVMTQIEKTATVIGDMSKKYQKPIICSFMGGEHTQKGKQLLNRYRVPSYNYPERAIRALSAMWAWRQYTSSLNQHHPLSSHPIDSDSINSIISYNQIHNHPNLDSDAAAQILNHAGIHTPPSAVVDTYEQALDFATNTNFPVVLKLSGPQLLHKTEVGGVITNITSPEELAQKWEQLWQQRLNLDPNTRSTTRFLIQQQVASGVELIVGIKRDPSFGPVLMFGSGGTLAELVKDRNLFVLPISTSQIQNLIFKSRAYKLLSGFRGQSAYDLTELVRTIEILSQLSLNHPHITDIEINPVIVNHQGTWSVDGKILIQQ